MKKPAYLIAAATGFGLLLSASLALAANPPLTATFTSTAPHTTAQNPIPVTVTFSEGVTNFTASQLNIGNGSVTNFASSSASVYTFGVIPAASGSVSIDLNGGQVTGVDGQTNQAAAQLQFIYDPNAGDVSTTTATSTGTSGSSGSTASTTASTTAPTVSITSPANGSSVSSSSLEFDFTFAPTDATVSCSFGDSTTTYACGSPQIFGSDASPLPNGTYPFSVFVSNSAGSASASTTVTYTFASSTTSASSTPVMGCTNSTATNFNASATQDDGSCTFHTVGSGPSSSGGGGGGGGMIVGSGPLAPGWVNTNPYGSATTQTSTSGSGSGSLSINSLPPNAGFPLPGQVAGTSTTRVASASGSPVGVGSHLTSSTRGYSSSASASSNTGSSHNTGTVSTDTGSSSIFIDQGSSTSSTTPGIPNTGGDNGATAWMWIVGIVLVLLIAGGAWLLVGSTA